MQTARIALLCSALASVIILSAALALEHIGGFKPCPLCLEQRYAYYAAIPFGLLGWTITRGEAGRHKRLGAAVAGLLLACIFTAGAYLGVSHAGAEWGIWDGPSSCGQSAVSIGMSAAEMVAVITDAAYVSCLEPELRIFGLSLAGWNSIASAVLAAVGIFVIRKSSSR